MKKYKNTMAYVGCYFIDALEEMLINYSNAGYKLVSTQIVESRSGTQVMYLFFVKEIEE